MIIPTEFNFINLIPEKSMIEKLSNIEPVISKYINWNIIREQYNQTIKHTKALRIGTAETEAILKRFTRNNLKHPTYVALQ